MRCILLTIWCMFFLSCKGNINQSKNQAVIKQKPNVLFIAIDDLNDWVGCLKGHPQIKTPNIDKLARMGVLFANAHAQSPICNPSRTSVLTGLRPSTTGIYGLSPWFREVDSLKDIIALPQNFSQNGYKTYGVGKIYHGGYGRQDGDKEFDSLGPYKKQRAFPEEKIIGYTPGGNHKLMDWGTFPHKDEDKEDWQTASWAVDVLNSEHQSPFFLAVGFFLPHVPLYTTQKWFDMYSYDTLEMPPLLRNDRGDTPRFSWYNHWDVPEPRLEWLEDNKQLKPLVRSYLAAISFVDSQVGRVLKALEYSNYKNNTIIVLWSDHGYHLGEKEISGKNTLWERSTHVPLIFAGPGIDNNKIYDKPVELLDIFPTLNGLCDINKLEKLEGRSLVPILSNSNSLEERPAITTDNYKNHSIRTQQWRYIEYANRARELYDLSNDPNEWKNLANLKEYHPVMDSLSQWIPKYNHQPIIGNGNRVLTYKNGIANWEGKDINENDPIPYYTNKSY